MLRAEQTARHEVFRWYLSNWRSGYSDKWASFIREKGASFPASKKIAPEGSLLVNNLQQIMGQLQQHCPNCSSKEHVKNVLLFFYAANSKPPSKTSDGFEIVAVEYDNSRNYIPLS